jgi:hypothetical protein
LDRNPVFAETNPVPGLELEGRFLYKLNGKPVWRVGCEEKTLTLRSDYAAGAEGLPFVLTFDQKANHATLLGWMKPDERQMNLPCVLHLPDMGSLRITGNGKLDYTVKALYQLGRIEDARRIFRPMLAGYARGEFQGFGENGKSRDWRDWKGGCHGYEGLLVDNYYALLAVFDDVKSK